MLRGSKGVDIRFLSSVAALIVVGVFLTILFSRLAGDDGNEPGFRADGRAIVLGDGAVQVTLGTSDQEQWVGFSFALGRIVPEGPTADVYARRYLLRAPLGAADLGDDPIDVDAPRWQLDRSSGDERNPALSGWYNYNFLSNRLSSRGHTFAVRTPDDLVYVQIVSYTCETREQGCLTLRYWYSKR